jgi:hypothetical protein
MIDDDVGRGERITPDEINPMNVGNEHLWLLDEEDQPSGV